jgi:hypothetical protein
MLLIVPGAIGDASAVIIGGSGAGAVVDGVVAAVGGTVISGRETCATQTPVVPEDSTTAIATKKVAFSMKVSGLYSFLTILVFTGSYPS